MDHLNKILEIRKELNYRQDEFSLLIDITQSNLSLIESGKIGISKRVLKKLNSIGIDADQALGKKPYDIEKIIRAINPVDRSPLPSNTTSNNNLENLFLRIELLELKVKNLEAKK